MVLSRIAQWRGAGGTPGSVAAQVVIDRLEKLGYVLLPGLPLHIWLVGHQPADRGDQPDIVFGELVVPRELLRFGLNDRLASITNLLSRVPTACNVGHVAKGGHELPHDPNGRPGRCESCHLPPRSCTATTLSTGRAGVRRLLGAP